MFTVCPKCALTLVVTAADLRVAQGYVRCGRCSNVFNALARLSDERQAGAAPPADPAARDTSASSRMRGPASDTSRTRALQESVPGPAAALKRDVSAPPPAPRPASTPPASAPSQRFDDDSIPEDALEFNPDATDVSKVFVEQAPSPEFKAATGTFRAMRQEAADTQPPQPTQDPDVEDDAGAWVSRPGEPEGVQFDIELDSELLAEITGSRPRLDTRSDAGAAVTAAPATPEHTTSEEPDAQGELDEDAETIGEPGTPAPDALTAPEDILELTEPKAVVPAASPATAKPPADLADELAADLALAESRDAAAAEAAVPPAPHEPLATASAATPTAAAPASAPVPIASPTPAPSPAPASPPATASTPAPKATAPSPKPPAPRARAPQPAASNTARMETPTRRASPVETADAIRTALLPRKKTAQKPVPAESQAATDPLGRVWIAGTVAMVLLLGAQIIHHYRNDLAATSELHGPLTSLYGAFGVALVPRWNLTSYEVRQLGATTDADSPGRITVRASVKNAAHQTKPLPLLRVTLQDRFGNRIASRDVPPQSYLPRAIPSTSLLSSGQRIDAEMVFIDPGTNAVGFEIDACLPAPGGGISCANDVAR